MSTNSTLGPQRNYNVHRGPRLRDPNNVESELTSDDFIIKPYAPNDHDRRVIAMSDERVLRGLMYRRSKEGEWFEALAFYLGQQNHIYNHTTGGMVLAKMARNPNKVRSIRNKIRPKVKLLESMLLANKPDAAVKPATQAKIDIQAAAEARAAIAHLDKMFRREEQTRILLRWALITCRTALKIYWNPNKVAEQPKFDPLTGELVGSFINTENPIGDLEEDKVPIFELIFDPSAHADDEVEWICHEKVRSLSYIRTTYPEFGECVRGDVGTGPTGYVESRMAQVVGEYMRGAEPLGTKKTSAIVHEFWEKPGDQYKEGRYYVIANGILLKYLEKWPNMDAVKLGCFPFAPLEYEQGLGTVYGKGVVTDMVDAQRSLNDTKSRMQQHRNTSWGKLFIEEGSRVPPNAFDDCTPNEKIPYARGSTQPHLEAAPEMPQSWLAMNQGDQTDLDDSSGVHEVTEGHRPPGIDSGVAIGKLQQSDMALTSDATGNLENYHLLRAKIELHVLGRNYIEDRMVFISQGYFGDPGKKLQIPGQGLPGAQPPAGMPPMGIQSPMAPMSAGGITPQMPGMSSGSPMPPPSPMQVDPPEAPVTAAMEAKAFTALNQGGSCHVEIVAGSAAAKDPQAQRDEVFAFYKEGLYGPPGDPSTAAIVLAQLEIAGGDQIIESMQDAAQKRMLIMLATQPNPAQIQQQQAEAAAAQQSSQQAHLQQMQGMQQAHDLTMAQAKAQLEQQALESKMQVEAYRVQFEQQMKMQAQQQQQQFDAQMSILARLHPELRLTGAMDAPAIASAERAIGLDTPTTEQIEDQMEANLQKGNNNGQENDGSNESAGDSSGS